MSKTKRRHTRKPWAVERADGTVWGRYEKREPARIMAHVFNQPPMTQGGPYKVTKSRRHVS